MIEGSADNAHVTRLLQVALTRDRAMAFSRISFMPSPR